jgi:hypothetical protein
MKDPEAAAKATSDSIVCVPSSRPNEENASAAGLGQPSTSFLLSRSHGFPVDNSVAAGVALVDLTSNSLAL